MVDINVISRKLTQLSLRMAKVRMHCPADPEDIAEDSDELMTGLGDLERFAKEVGAWVQKRNEGG
jgi:hypothetical protein